MKFILFISVILNLALIIKICAMRFSLKELTIDFRERADLDSDSLLGVSSRDKRIRELATAMNETISKLRLAYHSYKQGDERLKRSITNVAHDIRTPLTAMCGYLELAERCNNSPEMKKYLDVIDERAQYMKKMINEFFDYSLMVSKNDTIEENEKTEDVNINQMLEDALMNFYPTLMEKKIELKAEITDEHVIRRLIPSYVERIFGNLISNAIKYSDGDLTVILSEDGRFRMMNSASSLDKVKVGKLFERFFTVETADGSTSGAGLGLSIVKSFAEKMNCPITADYEDGKLVIEIDF